MKVRKIILGYFFILMISSLGGCSVPTDEENLLNSRPIDVSEATEILFDKKGNELTDLLQVDFKTDKGNADIKAETYNEISECVRNKNDIFFVKSYGKAGAQSYDMNQIYRSDLEQNRETLLYETSDAVCLNEFLANDTNLYWVEYVFSKEKDDFDYNVMQYNLTTEEVICIASRNAAESEEICLAVSNEYVVWYDSYFDGRVQITIYDVMEQECQTIQDTDIQKFMPYERLNIVDNGITFFTQDDEGLIYINRYNLNTHKTDVLLLGKTKDFKKLAACFSNSKYIGWLTEYSYGTYYFYDIENGNLYSLSQSDKLRVFSGWLSDYLYINDSQNGCVYAYDFDTKETYYQNVTQGTALSLKPYGEQFLYMKVIGDENVELLTVQFSKEKTESEAGKD